MIFESRRHFLIDLGDVLFYDISLALTESIQIKPELINFFVINSGNGHGEVKVRPRSRLDEGQSKIRSGSDQGQVKVRSRSNQGEV